MDTARYLPVRLGFFYVAIFLIMGVHLPYWPVWLAARGLDASEIGTMMALALVLRVGAGPAVALLADRVGRRRGPIILLAAGTLAGFALFAFTQSFWSILLVTLLTSALFPSMMPLVDTLTLAQASRHGFDYGRVRLWGSVSFIAASVGGGWVLARSVGADMVLTLVLVASAVTLLGAVMLPRDAPSAARPEQGRRTFTAARRLCTNPQFLLFVFAAATIQAGHAVYYAFGTLNWQRAGIDDTTIGLLWAVGVVSEIVLFAFAGTVLARIGPVFLIALGGGAGVLRWSASAFDPGLAILIPLQCLHAFTFGATHLGAMHFLNRAAAPDIAATAQSVYAALSAGFVIGGVTYFSGLAYAEFQGLAYLGMAAICAMGGICGLRLARIWSGGRLID